MILQLRPFLICLLAYVAALLLTLLALAAMIDLGSIGFDTEVPRSAVLAPMIAVVGFWGICRVFGVPLDPARTFLIGAIAVYGLLFFMGRIVALTSVNTSLVTFVGFIALFAACYAAVIQALRTKADAL